MYYSKFGQVTDLIGRLQDNSEHYYKNDKSVSDEIRFQALLSKAAYSLPTSTKITDNTTSGIRFMEQLKQLSQDYPEFGDKISNLEVIESSFDFIFLKDTRIIEVDGHQGNQCHLAVRGSSLVPYQSTFIRDLANDVQIFFGQSPHRAQTLNNYYQQISINHPECLSWTGTGHSFGGRQVSELSSLYPMMKVDSFEPGKVLWDMSRVSYNPFISKSSFVNQLFIPLVNDIGQNINLREHRLSCDPISKGWSSAGTVFHYPNDTTDFLKCHSLDNFLERPNYPVSVNMSLDRTEKVSASIGVRESEYTDWSSSNKLSNYSNSNSNCQSNLLTRDTNNNYPRENLDSYAQNKYFENPSEAKVSSDTFSQEFDTKGNQAQSLNDTETLSNQEVDEKVLKVLTKTQIVLQETQLYLGLANHLKNWKLMSNRERVYGLGGDLSQLGQLLNNSDNLPLDIVANIFKNDFIHGHEFARETFITLSEFISKSLYHDNPQICGLISDAFNIIRDLAAHKSCKKDVEMLLVDLLVYLMPELTFVVALVKTGLSITHLVKSAQELTAKYDIIKINGLSGASKSYISFSHGKSGHDVIYSNDYFHISAKTWAKHERDAKKLAEIEFKKQAHDKVYRKIGIPYELLDDDDSKKPQTLTDEWRKIKYLKTSQDNWLRINGHRMTSQEQEQMVRYWNESEHEKEQRTYCQKHQIRQSLIEQSLDLNLWEFILKIKDGLSQTLTWKEFIDYLFKIFARTEDPQVSKDKDLLQDSVDETIDKLDKEQNKDDNQEMKECNDDNTEHYTNQTDEYTKKEIVWYANGLLCVSHTTVRFYKVNYESCLAMMIGRTLANLDNNICDFIRDPWEFVLRKNSEFVSTYKRIIINSVIVDHVFITISLLYLEEVAEEIRVNYVAPVISFVCGFIPPVIYYLMGYKEYKSLITILKQNIFPAVRTTLGVGYYYAKQAGMYMFGLEKIIGLDFKEISEKINSLIVSSCEHVSQRLMAIKDYLLVKVPEICSFLHIPGWIQNGVSMLINNIHNGCVLVIKSIALTPLSPIFIQTVIFSAVTTLIFRVSKFLYNKYQEMKKARLNRGIIIIDWKVNRPRIDWKEKPSRVDWKENGLRIDWKDNRPRIGWKDNCPKIDWKENCPNIDWQNSKITNISTRMLVPLLESNKRKPYKKQASRKISDSQKRRVPQKNYFRNPINGKVTLKDKSINNIDDKVPRRVVLKNTNFNVRN